MSLNLPDSVPDLFAMSGKEPLTANIPQSIGSSIGPKTESKIGGQKSETALSQANASVTLGSVLSAVLRDDPEIQKQMSAAEKAAVAAVIKNVGTPDEYPTAAEYVLRTLPYVRSVYGSMDVIQPAMPSQEEIWVLMASRFTSA